MTFNRDVIAGATRFSEAHLANIIDFDAGPSAY